MPSDASASASASAPEASAAAAQRSPTNSVDLPLSRTHSQQASLDTSAHSDSHDAPQPGLAPSIKPRISSMARSPASCSHSISDEGKEIDLTQAGSDDKHPIMDSSARYNSIDTYNLSTLSFTVDSSSPDHPAPSRYVNLVGTAQSFSHNIEAHVHQFVAFSDFSTRFASYRA